MKLNHGLLVALCAAPFVVGSAVVGAEIVKPAAPAELEHFEQRVRPLLATHCFECHGPKKEHNGLRLDSRSAMLKGGDGGAAIVPGRPEQSLLIEAVKHESFEMPPEPAEPLKPTEIAALERWIRAGAPWPAEQTAAAAPQSIAERAKKFWAFQPVRDHGPPAIKNSSWSADPIDRFLAARWEAAKLEPAAEADPRTLIRRVSFVLTGLPPTPDEVEVFAAASARGGAEAERAYAALVDKLLASPRFGERWARHWMDWVRYCESHGSEGDPAIPFAWRYRDYLIRALNADVPYDQLVREHLAGDLLAQPRRNEELGINESILGTAHLRFVEHGYQPVDPLEDMVKVTDNQIDVAMKSFQALTVTCARCHDHKFDAISQADFYALFPVFAAPRPGQVQIDLPERLHQHDARLEEIKRELKAELVAQWAKSIEELPERLAALPETTKKNDERGSAPSSGSLREPPSPQGAKGAEGEIQAAINFAPKRFDHPLHLWTMLGRRSDRSVAETFAKLSQRYQDEARSRAANAEQAIARRVVLDEAEYAKWRNTGAGAPQAASKPGELIVAVSGAAGVQAILPAGVYTHRLSSKHGAVLTSPTFRIDSDAISVRLVGSGYGQARLCVQNYAVPRGGIYNLSAVPLEPGSHWFTWDTTFWRGFDAYLEVATNDDLTIASRAVPKDAPPPPTDGRSTIGIREIWFHNAKAPPAVDCEPRSAGAWVAKELQPKSAGDVAKHYQRLAREALAAWRSDTLSDEQAELLNALAAVGVLPNYGDASAQARELVAEYRRLEKEIPVAQRAPGVVEAAGYEQPLMIRGDHTKLGDPIPRRYLEGLGSESLADGGSGRLRLAEQLADAKNPLTARVAVNRLWHYVFGRGLVATPDNFGELGRRPTHPELLDHLAARFVAEGWSIKRAVRGMVMSRTFRLASTPSAAAKRHDPENLLLSHASVRRLDAEAIRDSLVFVAGRLQATVDGGPGYVHGEPPRMQTRRSVFVTVKRNGLPQFLETFDWPKPFTTIGARDVTNVPGQALTMLNDIVVIDLAKYWAKAELEHSVGTIDERIARMYRAALARAPDAEELAAARGFLDELAATHNVPPADRLKSERVWQDFGHALFNMKEFIYVR